MSYKQSEMLYNDGKYYKTTAKADHDNPYYTKGTDHSELNRTELYEVHYFINHIADKWSWTPNAKPGTPGLPEYRKIEKMIRYDVPSNIRTHAKIENWIKSNWASYSL